MSVLPLIRLILLLVTAQVAESYSIGNFDSNDIFPVENHLDKKTIDEIRQQLSQQLDQLQQLTDIRQQRQAGGQPVTPTLTHSLNDTGSVVATALLNDELFATSFRVAQVSVFDKTSLQLQRQLKFPGLGSDLPGLATCSANNYLYVSDSDGECIHRVDLSATNNNVIKWKVCNHPAGLSVNNARNVLVACWSPNKVQEYNSQGTLVRQISHNTDVWHAVGLSSGLVAVSRMWSINGIAIVSMDDGRVIHSYGSGSRGSGVGQMNFPRCIAVDRDGYILVADQHNHRILVLNPTLTVGRPLPLPENTSLQYPVALSLDQSRGRLYVGENGGKNRLLVFDNIVNIASLFDN